MTKAPAAPRWVTPSGDIVYAAVERTEIVCREPAEFIYCDVELPAGIEVEFEPDPER